MKYIKILLKNIILSTITIYSINIVLNKINIIVPLNYYSIGITSILGFPGLLSYILLVMKYYR